MNPDQEHRAFIDRKLTAMEDPGPAGDEAALTLAQWAIAWSWIAQLSEINELPEVLS